MKDTLECVCKSRLLAESWNVAQSLGLNRQKESTREECVLESFWVCGGNIKPALPQHTQGRGPFFKLSLPTMHWALLSRQWKDEARWMTKGENGDLGWAWFGRQGGKRERRGVCFPNQSFLWKMQQEGGGGKREKGEENVAFCLVDEEEMYAYTENLSLMISLLACTQTYKNNTARISTWHHVIITVLQTFKNKRIQTELNMMEHLHHSWKKSAVSSCLKLSKTRNTTWSKEVSTFFLLKKTFHSCTPIRWLAPYIINVMTLVSQTTTQPCNL